MLQYNTLSLICLLSCAALFTAAQDSVQAAKPTGPYNIVILTRDIVSIKGRVIEINLDHIVLDAKEFNSPVNLSAYYIRPKGDYYRIDVQYIQAAVVEKKKKVGASVLQGAADGTSQVLKAATNSGATMGEVAVGTAAGLAIGSLVGTVKGMGRKRVTVPIYGSSENLMTLLNYYQ
jgi:hypothetical protein